MRTLYHHPLCPFSRLVRVVLAEKKLEFALHTEKFWEARPEFVALNPASETPVLVEENGLVLCEGLAIVEYLNEVYRDPLLLPIDPAPRAEARRLVGWFNYKFHVEVTDHLLAQKVFRRLGSHLSEPDSRRIRAAFSSIHAHLDYIGWLTERRAWLAGATFSLADIAAGVQISCLDFIGDVPWDAHPAAKDWYARIKSRPSFRPLLADHLPGIPAPPHYADLDF